MLKIENITAGYGTAKVLHGASFTVAPGQVACLLGRNGAGKTTTLKCIMGLLGITSGEIKLEEQAINGIPSYRIARRGIGYVPEQRLIFPDLTVSENLSIGLWRGQRDAKQAAERVLALFPRLSDKWTTKGGSLSGGEQQMLSIGRALMPNPLYLVVDEPTEGLAPVIVKTLELGLKTLATQGVAVLVVESKLDVARHISDIIYVVGKGRIEFSGDMAALDARPDIRREYLEV